MVIYAFTYLCISIQFQWGEINFLLHFLENIAFVGPSIGTKSSSFTHPRLPREFMQPSGKAPLWFDTRGNVRCLKLRLSRRIAWYRTNPKNVLASNRIFSSSLESHVSGSRLNCKLCHLKSKPDLTVGTVKALVEWWLTSRSEKFCSTRVSFVTEIPETFISRKNYSCIKKSFLSTWLYKHNSNNLK